MASVFPAMSRLAAAVSVALGLSGVSIILPSDGTWTNTTGAFTLKTPLPTTYAGGAWLRFSAVGTNGSTGGPAASLLYWCVFTAPGVGQAYAASIDASMPFTPEVPAGPLIPLATVAGTHVQATGVEITMLNQLVVGKSMGERGALSFNGLIETTNAAGNKTIRTKFGGTNYFNASFGAGLFSLPVTTRIVNQGVPTAQIGTAANTGTGYTGSPNALTRGSADTNYDQYFLLTFQMASGNDFIIFNAFTFERITAP